MKRVKFLEVIIISLVLILLVMLVAPGCTTATEAETTATEAETTATEAETTKAKLEGEPKVGGTLVVAVDSEPLQLDVGLQQGNLQVSVIDLFNDFLWRWNEDFSEFVPRVAEKWEWTDDTHLKVDLRKGVLFHNGREVVAEDVAYSINRVKDPKTGSPLASFVEPITEVVVNDDYSLTIVLDEPWFGLMDRLTYIGIVPKEEIEKYGDLKTHPIGCGPFVFDKWEPGLQLTAKKFDGYYMEGKPYLDKVVVRFMPVWSTGKAALISGEVDLHVWPPPTEADDLRSHKDLVVDQKDFMATLYVGINTKIEPLSNKKVRQAIELAINREDFNQGVMNGIGTVCPVPLLKNSIYYDPKWEHERDVEKAKQLLKEAGYPNGFDIKILALKGNEEMMGEILYSNLKEVGINGVIDVVEIPEALDRIFSKGDFELCVLGDTFSPDPDFFASKYLVGNGQMAKGTGNWSNPEVERLIAEGRKTLDEEKRIEIYQNIYDIVLDEVPMVYLLLQARIPTYKNYVKNFFWYADIRYNWESVWVDK